MSLPVIVLGSGGHAKVVIDALARGGVVILGTTDRDPVSAGKEILGVPVLGTDQEIYKHGPELVRLVIGVGGPTHRRREIFEHHVADGYGFATVIHPAAIIAEEVEIAEAAQIMAGAIVQPGARIGANVIVNTGARVDHDCVIGDHAHIAPGAVLCGGVTIGPCAHVGAGATVIENTAVGDGAVVAAGAVVIATVPPEQTVAGVPARET